MKIHLIYPNSVFKTSDSYAEADQIWLIEEPLFFTQFKYHQQKLVLHRSSLKQLEARLIREYPEKIIQYFEVADLNTSVSVLNKAKRIAKKTKLQAYYPSDYLLEKRVNSWLTKNPDLTFDWLESPLFLNTRRQLKKYFDKPDVKHFRMEDWYQKERKRQGILIDTDGKPVGGKWNYDQENRKSLPKNHPLPDEPNVSLTKFDREAIDYVAKNFSDHPGNVESFWLPTSHRAAERWFQEFLEVRFQNFGPYEDAFIQGSESILYHSVLSPLINTGLLEVAAVVEKTLTFASDNQVPINSVEGFIRQLIGWREYVHGLYLYRGVEMRNQNFFNHTRSLPKSFWNNNLIGIKPVDDVIKKTLNTGYSHHIERLMVMANFFQLIQADPNQVYGWFMELYIDAYDWVMVPNVYSMGLYADGGIMATKPYVASSNYLTKMSNYRRKNKDSYHWSAVWDALYWKFMSDNREFLATNYRTRRTLSHLDAMSDLSDKFDLANKFLSQLDALEPYWQDSSFLQISD